MSQLARHYTVMEVRRLLEASEGQGPGTGGHAISMHGARRADVTDRRKPADSAFKASETLGKLTTDFEDSIMAGVFDDYQPTVKKMVHLSDQALSVCNALNSEKGQKALKKLDGKPDRGSFQTAFTADLTLSHLNPWVRAGSGSRASLQRFTKIYVEPWKIDGELHIHTAYSQ